MQTEYKTTEFSRQDGIAVLTIDNPPVNPMSPQLDRDLRDAFRRSWPIEQYVFCRTYFAFLYVLLDMVARHLPSGILRTCEYHDADSRTGDVGARRNTRAMVRTRPG